VDRARRAAAVDLGKQRLVVLHRSDDEIVGSYAAQRLLAGKRRKTYAKVGRVFENN
jgi:hypothetical protein